MNGKLTIEISKPLHTIFFSGTTEELDAILLSDIVNDIIDKRFGQGIIPGSGRIPVILKIDIEHFECRALLGSPWIFTEANIFIPYIVMEWTYLTRKGPRKFYPTSCPVEKLRSMAQLLSRSGYRPYKEGNMRVPYKVEEAEDWAPQEAVMWVHHMAKKIGV